MKRVLSLVLVLILCFALFACGDESDGEYKPTVPTVPPTTEGDTTTTTTQATTTSQQTTTMPDTTTSTTVKGESSSTTTTTKRPTTTTTTKPTTSTTQAAGAVRGVIDAPRTETLRAYTIDKQSYTPNGEQERTITYKGTIKVGNTAATSGAYGSVGAPFNEGIKTYFHNINFNGGIGGDVATGKQGYYIEFVHYNDQYNGSTALTLTKKLVEHDKIFALVGQVGTPAVEATYNYIRQQGLISVGAYSSSDKLHTFAFNLEEGAGIFPTYPIYYVEGQVIVGQMLGQHPDVRKIGILYTSDEVGTDVKTGAKEVISFLGEEYDYVLASFDSGSTSISNALNRVADCDALIIAATADNVEKALKGMITSKVYLPVFVPNVAALASTLTSIQRSYTSLPEENRFPIYSNTWVSPYDVETYLMYAEDVLCYHGENSYISNLYSMYGWMSADVFCTGLKRLVSSGMEITPENYVAAMESANVTLKMTDGAVLNYQAGSRFGTTTFALLKNNQACNYFEDAGDLKDYLLFILLREIQYIP